MNIAFLALMAALLSPVAAAPPANTAARADEAVFAFLPAQVKPVLPHPLNLSESGPLPDLTQPAAAIHQALGAALAGLTVNRPEAYAALLDTGYRQPSADGLAGAPGEIDKGETVRRLRALLARNQCADVAFGLAECRLETPDRAWVTVRERWQCLSRNTPPTRLTTADGQVAVVNNTVVLTATVLLRQEWVRRGTAWKLGRSETLRSKMTAVL